MSIGGILFGWCVGIGAWFMMGLACACLIRDILVDDLNPLWKIPLMILGLCSFLVVIFIAIYKLIKNYIKEVKQYYEHKNKNTVRKTRKLKKFEELREE